MKIKNILKISVVTLVAIPVVSQAFISYEDKTPSAFSSDSYNQGFKTPTPLSFPMAQTRNPAPPKEVLRMSCQNGGQHFNKGEIKPYSGQAPLSQAAFELAPVGWITHDMSGNSDIAIWAIKGTWTQALAQAANSVGSCVFIDWKSKKITLTQNKKYDPNHNSTNPTNASPVPSIPIVAPPKHVDLNTWTLTTDKTLKQNLIAWGEKSGWRVVWKIKNTDFKVTHTATLSGTFIQAIEALLLAYENGNTPFSANLYESNRVIEFIDHTPFKRNIIQ
jgi:hypothetical protein